MDDEKAKFQLAALKFLYEIELLDDPQLINNLKLNVFSVSPSIREVELVCSYHHKSILVWLELSWLGRKFLQKRITADVLDRVQQLLPNFKFRVVTDRNILELALKQVESVMKGGNNAQVSSTISDSSNSNGGS